MRTASTTNPAAPTIETDTRLREYGCDSIDADEFHAIDEFPFPGLQYVSLHSNGHGPTRYCRARARSHCCRSAPPTADRVNRKRTRKFRRLQEASFISCRVRHCPCQKDKRIPELSS